MNPIITPFKDKWGNVGRYERYYYEGKLHREDGPAVIEYLNDILVSEEYFINGIPDRENNKKPSSIGYNFDFINGKGNGNIVSEMYRVNGGYHRDDGPAIIHYNEDGTIRRQHYYINGKDITEMVEKNSEIMKDKYLRKILL